MNPVMRNRKRLARILVLWLVLGPVSGCYFLDSEPVPEISSYALDLSELSALSLGGSGELPVEVRIEEIATATLPGKLMMAGKSWDGVEMVHVVWNLDAILELRYRTRLVTDWVIGEGREAAIHQLRALRDLYDQQDVDIVISHDRRTHESAGIGRGFVLPTDHRASRSPADSDPARRARAGDARALGQARPSHTLELPATRDTLEKS